MRATTLVRMINQIAAFHRAYPREEAVSAVAKHLRDFWDPRMRAALAEHLESGGSDLCEIARAAAAEVCGESGARAPSARVA